jgi:hypothetical protein
MVTMTKMPEERKEGTPNPQSAFKEKKKRKKRKGKMVKKTHGAHVHSPDVYWGGAHTLGPTPMCLGEV